jgi:hypothetical protein
LSYFTYHLYAFGTEEASLSLTPTELVTGFCKHLEAIQRELANAFEKYDCNPSKPVHVTEWHFAGEGGSRDMNSCAYLVNSAFSAMFASSALTWFQYPGFNIERAYWYVGHSEGAGLFYQTEIINYEGPAEYRTVIRPAAFAMALHSDLVGDFWLPITMRKLQTEGVPVESDFAEDVIDAVCSKDYRISVLAGRVLSDIDASTLSGQRLYSAIVTNSDRAACNVRVCFNGIDADTYKVRVKKLEQSDFEERLIVRSTGMNDSDYLVPDRKEAVDLFLRFTSMSSNLDQEYDVEHAGGSLEIEITVLPFSVNRVDIGIPEAGIESPLQEEATEEPKIPIDTSRFDLDSIIEAEGRKCIPFISSGMSRRQAILNYKTLLKGVSDFMEAAGYAVDAEMRRKCREYFAIRIVENPDELSSENFYAWFLGNR